MRLSTSISSPTSEQVCYTRGGNIRIALGNRLLVTDHDLKGFSDHKVDPGLEKFIYEFTSVPSNLPTEQAVVIQLSIG